MKRSEFEELLKATEGIETYNGKLYLDGKEIDLQALYEQFNSEIMSGEKIDVLAKGSRIVIYEPGSGRIQNIKDGFRPGIIVLLKNRLIFFYRSAFKSLLNLKDWESDSFKINTIDVLDKEVFDLIIKTSAEKIRFTILDLAALKRICRLIEEQLEEYQKERQERENAQRILKNMTENQGDTYHIGQAGAVGRYARSDNNTFIKLEQKQTLAEAATEIQRLLKQLEQTNPTAIETDKVAYVNDETTPSFKRRMVGALQASGETAIDEFILESKYLKVVKAAIEGWLQPGSKLL